MSDLVGRRVLVTGASRGLGRGIAAEFAAAGAHVVLTARNMPALEETRRLIERSGGTVDRIISADLATREGCRSLSAQCADVDVLINNAAETSAKFMDVLTRDDAYWERQLQLNLIAPLTLMQELGPAMVRKRRGSIINISSVSAQRGTPLHASYSVSKAALEALTKIAAMELAKYNVNVVAVAPGNLPTNALAEACGDAISMEELGRRLTPIGRLVSLEEVAGLCVHLARDCSKALTGTVMTIDGGLTTGMHLLTSMLGLDA